MEKFFPSENLRGKISKRGKNNANRYQNYLILSPSTTVISPPEEIAFIIASEKGNAIS